MTVGAFKVIYWVVAVYSAFGFWSALDERDFLRSAIWAGIALLCLWWALEKRDSTESRADNQEGES